MFTQVCIKMAINFVMLRLTIKAPTYMQKGRNEELTIVFENKMRFSFTSTFSYVIQRMIVILLRHQSTDQ